MSGNTKQKRRSSQYKKKIYWDTCIFLAWIKDEETWTEDVKKGIEQTIEMASSGEVLIVTSALTMAEILEAKMTLEQKQRFEEIFAAPYLQLVDIDRRISARSSMIRDYHDTRVYSPEGSLKGGSFMRMPDALHVATAIHMNVTALHTLDGYGKNPKRLDLLELDGNVAGFPLAIKRPTFIAPPEFSSDPIGYTSGSQISLFHQMEVTDDAIAPKEANIVAIDVQRGGDGHPKNQAGAEGSKGNTKDSQEVRAAQEIGTE